MDIAKPGVIQDMIKSKFGNFESELISKIQNLIQDIQNNMFDVQKEINDKHERINFKIYEDFHE